MWINYQFMAVCPLILNFLHISSQKWLVFANYFGLPNFLPQLANFLHGYIRHIRDIFQLWWSLNKKRSHQNMMQAHTFETSSPFSFFSIFWRIKSSSLLQDTQLWDRANHHKQGKYFTSNRREKLIKSYLERVYLKLI